MPRHIGASYSVPVPAKLQPFFTVNHFNIPMHGRGRHPRLMHKLHHASLHAMGRQPDPWHGKGKPSGH